MTAPWWGAVLGALVGLGLLLVLARIRAIRTPRLQARVMPYLRDLPRTGPAATPRRPARSNPLFAVFGPVLRRAAETVEQVMGGAASVERRLGRAGIDKTVHEFRIEQVLWGLGGFGIVAAYGLLRQLSGEGGAVMSLVLSLLAVALGVMLRDSHLTSQVKTRERRIVAEFPTVAELLALAVAAGEGPVPALERVTARSSGELSWELGRVLAEVRTGTPVGEAFDDLAARTGVPVVSRFASGVAVAVERGTPLADVLHAQAADVREAGRRELIESAARKEVVMMAPIVFLVLPVVILFVLYPGAIGLNLVVD